MGQGPQSCELFSRGSLVLDDPAVNRGRLLDLLRPGGHHFGHALQRSEQVGLHRDSGAEDCNPVQPPTLDLGHDSLEQTDERERSYLRELRCTNLRGECRNSGDLCSPAGELAEESCQVLRQLSSLTRGGEPQYLTDIRVHHEDLCRESPSQVCLYQ